MKNKHYLLTGFIFLHVIVHAQVKIGDNATSINAASLLELETTNKGFVLPRVSITDVSASSPLASGLLTGTVVYNTNTATTGGSGVGVYYWDGSKWNFLTNTTNYWSLTGNSGMNASTNFIGTTDATDFVVRTNNTERIHVLGAASGSSKEGWIGMGITPPRSSLDVTGNFTNKNVITIQNTSNSGYSSVDMMDDGGNLKGTFGYGNSGTGSFFGSRDYFSTYGSDFVLNTTSGTFNLFMKGSTGNIGINTGSPGATLDVNGTFKLGSSGSVLTNIIKTSASINSGSVSPGLTTTVTVTVTGATTGSSVIVNPRTPLSAGLLIAYSYVSAANTVTIGFTTTGATVNPGSTTFDITVIK